MPLVSQAQARWMFANDPRMAKRWAAHTPSIKKLPKRVRTTPQETEGQASKAAALPTTDGGAHQPVLATHPLETPFEPLFVDATPAKQADAPQVDARFRGIGLVSTPSGDRMVDIAVSHARATFSEKLAQILARRSPESGPAEPADALSGHMPVAQIIDLRMFPSICPREAAPDACTKSAAVETLQRAILNLTNPEMRTPTVSSLLAGQQQGGRGQMAPLGPGKSPNANPINAFSGLSSSGSINGNAALGVKNNPGGSLKAGAQMPSEPEQPATDWSDRLVRLAMRRHPGTKEQALAALNAELDKQAGLAATIRTTTREAHDPICPHCNEVMPERHWAPDREKRGMYRHRGPCYDKGPFEIHWPDQAERDAQTAKTLADWGLGEKKALGDELAFKAWKATGLSDEAADRKAGESLEVPHDGEGGYTVAAGERCQHCGALFERGDDGNCNGCGKQFDKVPRPRKLAHVEPLPRWKKEPQTTDWRPHAQWVGPLLASLACGLDANGHVVDLARTKTAEESPFDITPFFMQEGDTERIYRPMYQQPAAGQPADRLYPVPRPFRSSVIDGLNMQPFDEQRTSAMTNVLNDTNRRAGRIDQAMGKPPTAPAAPAMPGGGSFAPGSLPKSPSVKAPAAPKAPTSAATKAAGSPLSDAAELRMSAGESLGFHHNENFLSSLLRRLARKRPDAGLPSPPMPGAGKFEGPTPGPFSQPLPRPAPKPVPGMMAKVGSTLQPALTGEHPEPRDVKPYAQFGEEAAADVHARFERKELIGSRPAK